MNEERRETLRRVHRDRLRPLRVVEYLDNSAVFTSSPVEVKEAYAVSDRDTGELFLVMIFRCLSQKPLAALDIRLLFYDGGRVPVPARREEFRYSWEAATFGGRSLDGQVRKEKDCKREKAIVHGEEFGEGIFLPLPEDYFRKLQIELVGAEYTDGSYETLELSTGGRAKRFADVESDLRASYTQLNVFSEVEETHPIRVLPMAGENAWLCCCGHKNPATVPLCEICGREKDWQLANLSEEHLREVRQALDAEDRRLVKARKKRVLHDLSAFPQNRYLETEEEKQQKLEQFEQAKQELYVQREIDKALWHKKLILRILLLVLLVLAIMGVARLIMLGYELGIFVEKVESGIIHFIRRTMR